MQDYRQLAGQSYPRFAWTRAPLDRFGPILQAERPLHTIKDYSCGFVHERACEAITASGDAPSAIGLTRLVTARREPEVCTHRSRSGEATGIFNGADVHQRRECTDTRHRHEKPADRIHLDLLSYRLIESRYLLAQLPPGNKQWAH